MFKAIYRKILNFSKHNFESEAFWKILGHTVLGVLF